jgi:hypothetical protein
MPYNNAYGENISKKVNLLNRTHIIHEKQMNDMEHNNDITSQLESATMKHEDVHGGGGFQANTLLDSGYEPVLGPTGEPVKQKRTRKKAEPVVLGSKAEQHGGAMLSLQDMYKMHGQPPLTTHEYITVKAKGFDHPEDVKEGSGMVGGSSRSKRNEIVKQVMKEKNMTLPASI